ncbi:lipoprotein signal peptidase [Pelotomaculum thermopropionicum SI]|uniref:Lipoprotein signal peptidase n=1 Tax=Pelotomaculum thermopropionicum (strain DSM 13744 / JCM 10971 / SI) TaxID=370438 RepID=LSPA_PELTS|nr:RecName: Full=Lipoprotein signal peptidase; AltName: Full=Prolipoprotein signal peptidase; AltName: Full=Signal peptidase II; Short=SPase II [Pelotomaculum thermopropionicum SI]BAF60000.1 lipoprotein signal peptidase [Pelotomaculum thermopropionicum SI]
MFLFIIIAVVLLVDQATKAAVQMLMCQGESIPVVPPAFYLTYIMNPGAAFGLLPHKKMLFVTVTVIIIAGVLVGYFKIRPRKPVLDYGLGLVAGGALGNLADRLRYGLVVDFLDFRIWPVFNLADTAIVTGAFLLAWALLNDSDKSSKKERK